MRFFAKILASAEEPSLIRQLWQEFIDTYVSNPAYYEYLNLEGNDVFWLKIFILAMFIGLSIAAFCIVFDKRVLGEMVRKLLATDSLSPEKAKTLEELGYARNTIVRHSVRKGFTLRRVVRCREEEAFLHSMAEKREAHEEKRKTDRSLRPFKETDYPFDLEHDHFYIPEELKYTADIKFEKKGNTWFGALLFTLVLAVLYVILLFTLPEILEILNDFAGALANSGKSNIV